MFNIIFPDSKCPTSSRTCLKIVWTNFVWEHCSWDILSVLKKIDDVLLVFLNKTLIKRLIGQNFAGIIISRDSTAQSHCHNIYASVWPWTQLKHFCKAIIIKWTEIVKIRQCSLKVYIPVGSLRRNSNKSFLINILQYTDFPMIQFFTHDNRCIDRPK